MIEKLLSLLDKVKPTGMDRWQACCPAHADKSPSLAIRVNEDGTILIHCFAGCSIHEVLSAIGISLSDLFPEKSNIHPPIKRPFPASDILRCLAFEAQIVALTADIILRNEKLTTEDYDRFMLAHSRIQQAIEYGGLR